MISSSERPKKIKLSLLRKACAHYLAIQISTPSINVMRFENLQVTDINTLYPSLLADRARTKFRIRVKKGTGRESISCTDL